MRRFGINALFILAMLLFPALSLAQTTAVTATVTDSDSIAWANGTFRVTFVPNPNYSGIYQYQGAAFAPQIYTGTMDGTGALSVTVPDNNFISPAGTQWLFTLCPNASAVCTPVTLPVTGASVNLTATFSAAAIPPRFPAKGPGSYGYSTVEINQIPVPGGAFYNVTLLCTETWNGSSFSCSTSGTVTSFSAGNLNPLFNTSVATSTTTPSLTFTLQNAAAGTIYGNPSGSSGPPSFNAPSSFSGIGTVTSVSGLTPLFTVSNPTTTPTFAQIAQGPNVVFAGPASGGAANPTFRSLVGADLPNPSASTLGGIESKAAVTHQFLTAVSTSGVISSAQPTTADISGLSGFTQIQAVASGTPCTPPSANSFDACAFTVTWPASFADAVYIPSCWLLEPAANGGTAGTNTANIIYLASKTAADMSVIVQNARGAQNTPSQVYCIGIHP